MSFDIGSVFSLKRSVKNSAYEQKYEIKITESRGSDFKGKPINPNQDSIFYGDIKQGKSVEYNIINIKQQDSDYYAFHIGREVPTGLIRWRGFWMDTNGQDGDFEFVHMNT
jgi:hypothetical protein